MGKSSRGTKRAAGTLNSGVQLVQRTGGETMRTAIYNRAIPKVLNTVHRGLCLAQLLPSTRIFLIVFKLLLLAFVLVAVTLAADWNTPEQQLARKIVAVTGPGAVALTIANRSSLEKRDSDIIQNGLRSALEALGLQFVKPEQSAASVTITLSENPAVYVWVAQVHQGSKDDAIVMVSVPRESSHAFAHDSVPLALRKLSFWSQEERILDVAVLEENGAPSHIAVLDGQSVSLYRMLGGKWQREQSMTISHARPWPRDLRGRIVLARDHLFDIFLPSVLCRSSAVAPLTLNCRESDDPWPLVASGMSGTSTLSGTNFPSYGSAGTSSTVTSPISPLGAFFASSRNYFTGALAPGVGKFTTVPKFYSAAALLKEKYVLWFFAAVDGSVHMVDGMSDVIAKLNWGSDITSIKTTCGAGWQVLATSSGDGDDDSIRAYEFPDRDPVAVSTAVDLPGEVTALWTEAKGDTAIVIVRNRETRDYEALRLAVLCNQ